MQSCRGWGQAWGPALCRTEGHVPKRRDPSTDSTAAPGCPFPCRCPCVAVSAVCAPQTSPSESTGSPSASPRCGSQTLLLTRAKGRWEAKPVPKSTPKQQAQTCPQGRGLLGLNPQLPPAQVSHRWGRSSQQSNVLSGQGGDHRGCLPRAEPILGIPASPDVGPLCPEAKCQETFGKSTLQEHSPHPGGLLVPLSLWARTKAPQQPTLGT